MTNDTYSTNDKVFKLSELYLSKTFDFDKQTAEDFATAYLDTLNKINDVLHKNQKAVSARSLETFIKHQG